MPIAGTYYDACLHRPPSSAASPGGPYASRSPGWQSSTAHSLASVLNLTALAWPFFRIDRFTIVMPTRAQQPPEHPQDARPEENRRQVDQRVPDLLADRRMRGAGVKRLPGSWRRDARRPQRPWGHARCRSACWARSRRCRRSRTRPLNRYPATRRPALAASPRASQKPNSQVIASSGSVSLRRPAAIASSIPQSRRPPYAAVLATTAVTSAYR